MRPFLQLWLLRRQIYGKRKTKKYETDRNRNFFQSYNYGVWFQAYATQAFLRGRGYDAQIVNYSNLHDDEKLKMAFKGKNSYMGYLISFAKNILLEECTTIEKDSRNI